MPDAITLTTTLNRQALPAADQTQLVYLLVELMPSPAMAAVRMPLNIGLVLDQSGSMRDEGRLDQLKLAVKHVVDQLADDDYLSIVTFSGEPTLVLPSMQVGRLRRNVLKEQIDEIAPKWTGRDIASAIALGHAEVRQHLSHERVSCLLMLTDGQVSLADGNHDRGVHACLVEADRCGEDGISLLAFGVGTDWDERLLSEMAARSGGCADYVARPEDLKFFFASGIQAMQATVVQNAVLELHLAAGIALHRAWRAVPLVSQLAPSVLSDRSIRVALGALEFDTGQAVLVELAMEPRTPRSYRIAQAEATYDVPVQGKVGEKVTTDAVLHVTSDSALACQVNPRVMNLVEKVTACRLHTQELDDAWSAATLVNDAPICEHGHCQRRPIWI